VALGARMVEFGGWQMPVWYTDIAGEHAAVRQRAGLFDVSHMGEFEVAGSGAAGFLRQMLSNDVSQVAVGQAQYTIMTNDAGGTVDDLVLFRTAEDAYLLIVNAANIDKDRRWLLAHRPAGVEFRDRSDELALLALQGPHSQAILQRLTDLELSQLAYYHHDVAKVAGVAARVSRTGYTGEDGFEIMIDAAAAPAVWDAVLNSGEDATPAGLGARDTLRLEACFPLYGHELDDETSPVEAGLKRFVKPEGNSPPGAERLRRELGDGLEKRLIGLELLERGIARQGYSITRDGRRVGMVTSGTQSPTLGKAIGLGYVEPHLAEPGQMLSVIIRERAVSARVVRRPFYRRSA
jgi:aminomethyltransferase